MGAFVMIHGLRYKLLFKICYNTVCMNRHSIVLQVLLFLTKLRQLGQSKSLISKITTMARSITSGIKIVISGVVMRKNFQ